MNEAQLLQELADREKVRETVHRYCWAVDKGELADVMALFAEACQLELAPGRRYGDRAAVERWYGAYMANRMSVLRHLIHNQIIDLDGGSARSRSYFDAVGELNGESIVVAGYYEGQARPGERSLALPGQDHFARFHRAAERGLGRKPLQAQHSTECGLRRGVSSILTAALTRSLAFAHDHPLPLAGERSEPDFIRRAG